MEGVILDTNEDNTPESALLKAYQAAQWAAFSFSMIGMHFSFNLAT
jgi:hypothetical protein